MTTANKITIVRILLIPVFVLLGVYYGQSVRDGNPQRTLWLSAILVFIAASVSDGLDGYIARRYNQRSNSARSSIRLPTKGCCWPLCSRSLSAIGVINFPCGFWCW